MCDVRKDLMRYRLEMAGDRLRASKILYEAESYKDSIGRSYYAMFTSVRALLALEGQDFSKHAGVISYFSKNYIKTGILIRNFLSISARLFRSEIILITLTFLLYRSRMHGSSMNVQKNF